jgi:hypothetical protein
MLNLNMYYSSYLYLCHCLLLIHLNCLNPLKSSGKYMCSVELSAEPYDAHAQTGRGAIMPLLWDSSHCWCLFAHRGHNTVLLLVLPAY